MIEHMGEDETQFENDCLASKKLTWIMRVRGRDRGANFTIDLVAKLVLRERVWKNSQTSKHHQLILRQISFPRDYEWFESLFSQHTDYGGRTFFSFFWHQQTVSYIVTHTSHPFPKNWLIPKLNSATKCIAENLLKWNARCLQTYVVTYYFFWKLFRETHIV